VEEKGKDPKGQLIEQWARQIQRWRLVQPALLFLEVTKPLSFIASQGLLLCEPLLSSLYREPRVSEYANLMADRANVERLIALLEQGDSMRDSAGGEIR
jgi:hypothetical protein